MRGTRGSEVITVNNIAVAVCGTVAGVSLVAGVLAVRDRCWDGVKFFGATAGLFGMISFLQWLDGG